MAPSIQVHQAGLMVVIIQHDLWMYTLMEGIIQVMFVQLRIIEEVLALYFIIYNYVANDPLMYSIGNSYGYRPYPSSGISQQIQPTYGRRKRSTQNIPEIADRRYNSYGNSNNKAGICPLYGRRRRSVEPTSEGRHSRYFTP